MKILTVLSGILLAAAGAFCFAFQSTPFSGLAFPVGCAMVVSAILMLAAYVVAKRESHPSDTMLVEGIVSFLFGFSVLNNQVQDNMIALFFGAWLAIAGGSRISQSLAASRYYPRDWFKILPLAILNALLGAVMMMPSLLALTPVPVILVVALGFIVNGLSLLVYAMYMREDFNAEAVSRAEAKEAASKAKRREHAKLRSLSSEERREAQAKRKAEKKEARQEKREERRLEKEAAKEARRSDLDRTIELSKEESDAIERAAEESGFAEKAREAEAPQASAAAEPEEAEPPEKQASPENAEPSPWPTFHRPTDIPSVRQQAPEAQEESAPVIDEVELTAVNLEEVEAKSGEIKFDQVELPKVEMQAEGGEAARRAEILRWLAEKSKAKTEPGSGYTPLSLDDLISEELPRHGGADEDKRFTQTLSFHWDDPPDK